MLGLEPVGEHLVVDPALPSERLAGSSCSTSRGDGVGSTPSAEARRRWEPPAAWAPEDGIRDHGRAAAERRSEERHGRKLLEQVKRQGPRMCSSCSASPATWPKVMTFRSLYRLERRGAARLSDRGRRRGRLVRRRPEGPGPDSRSRALGETLDDAIVRTPRRSFSYVAGDFSDAETYKHVADAISEAQTPVFYLEIPPFLFGTVIKGLHDAGLTDAARVVVEKPFGHDRESAHRARRRDRISTSTSRSCTGSTTSSGRWAWPRSSTCGSPTRCSNRSGAGTTFESCRSRWPSRSASRTAATSTTPSARCATSW